MVRTPGRAMSRQMRSAWATTLPASRIRPISRGDFNSGAFDENHLNTEACLSVQDPFDARVDLLDPALAVDVVEQSLILVVGDEVHGILVVLAQPLAHRLFLVVGPLKKGMAADVAQP